MTGCISSLLRLRRGPEPQCAGASHLRSDKSVTVTSSCKGKATTSGCGLPGHGRDLWPRKTADVDERWYRVDPSMYGGHSSSDAVTFGCQVCLVVCDVFDRCSHFPPQSLQVIIGIP